MRRTDRTPRSGAERTESRRARRTLRERTRRRKARQEVGRPDRETPVDPVHLRRSLATPRRAGLLLLFIFFAGFGGWSATAPLAGGAIAPGVVSPDGSRRTVQHLEGGLIDILHVRDGDEVHVGDPLLTLGSAQPKAAHDVLREEQLSLLATEARLRAELADEPDISFPAAVTSGDDPDLVRLREGQSAVHGSRRNLYAMQRNILEERIERFRKQIEGLEAQLAEENTQRSLIGDELEAKEVLLRKGLTPRPEILRLRRAASEIDGRSAGFVSKIATMKQEIAEVSLQILSLDLERKEKATDELDRVRSELASVNERLLASRDVLDRTTVVAPVAGTVVGMQFKTRGGVVQPGEPILDIVPRDESLVVDARVSLNDVDIVRPGLPAQVHLTAYSARKVAQIAGKVVSISADRLADERTGEPYYLARVKVDAADIAALGADVQLVPGMPASVLIVTGKRTMLGYLTQPIRDALRLSFRET